MKIYGIDIKPGMVIKTVENVTYVAFPLTAGGVGLANITNGGWRINPPSDIEFIRDVAPYDNPNICSGKVLYKRK